MMSTLLLLADGRFPAGGHAHSGGLEEAVAAGRVENEEDLLRFLAGRLATAGRVDATLAAASWAAAPVVHELVGLDAEAAARCPSPALRKASRAQGRGVLRAARSIWPAVDTGEDDGADQGSPGNGTGTTWSRSLAAELPDGPMYPVALGAIAKQIGLGPVDVALVAAQASVSGPSWAATRLFGLDPFAVGRCLARLTGEVETVATEAVTVAASISAAGGTAAGLPAYSAPLIEIGAEGHAGWEVRLFAS